MGDLYFWRQIYILTTCVFSSMSAGLMMAFPAVLIPSLSPNSTDITATQNQVSWMVASNGFTGMIGFLVLSPIMQLSGRKFVYHTQNIFHIAGWVVFLLANNITALFAARLLHGFSIGVLYITCMIVGEYTDPKRRGYFMTIKKATIALAILMCHASALVLDWRRIATLAIILPTISIFLTLFWPESPSYLAMKGRFKESEESFVWLHGGANMKELQDLLSSQKKNQENKTSEKWFKSLLRKDFLKPFAIVSILTLLLDLGGKYYFVVYVIQIMVELLGDKSIALYCTLGADILSTVALIFSGFVISSLKRRTILFTFGPAIVVIMLLIWLFIVLKLSPWMTPALILLQSFTINLSLIPVSFALMGEVFPLEHKGVGSCATGIVFTLLYTITLRLAPFLMENTGVAGVYAIYGICIGVCLVILYYLVPETKDRTLQEIENELKGIQPVDIDRLCINNVLVKKQNMI